MACREGNLRVLREAAFLLWENGDRKRLRRDWCELMGSTGLLTLELLEREGALAPGGFIVLDDTLWRAFRRRARICVVKLRRASSFGLCGQRAGRDP
jgi:hypothetical protein